MLNVITTLFTLVDKGRLPALLAFGLAFLCVCLMGGSVWSPALLAISNQLATIAELCIGFGTASSVGHSIVQRAQNGKSQP